MSELTPWFPPEVKPVRPGIYQTEEPDGSMFYNEFDGVNWFYGNYNCTPSNGRLVLPMRLLKRWRGLSSDPSGKGE